jgi:hypothetical protein
MMHGRSACRPTGGVDQPLILHYDGKNWKQVPAPTAPGFQLAGVAASTRTNAWAVGSDHNQTEALALHWNGRTSAAAP